MICNRKAFVLASGCPQVVVNLSFPDLDFCSTPEYTEPTLVPDENSPPNMIQPADINFPGSEPCFSIHATIDYSIPIAREGSIGYITFTAVTNCFENRYSLHIAFVAPCILKNVAVSSPIIQSGGYYSGHHIGNVRIHTIPDECMASVIINLTGITMIAIAHFPPVDNLSPDIVHDNNISLKATKISIGFKWTGVTGNCELTVKMKFKPHRPSGKIVKIDFDVEVSLGFHEMTGAYALEYASQEHEVRWFGGVVKIPDPVTVHLTGTNPIVVDGHWQVGIIRSHTRIIGPTGPTGQQGPDGPRGPEGRGLPDPVECYYEGKRGEHHLCPYNVITVNCMGGCEAPCSQLLANFNYAGATVIFDPEHGFGLNRGAGYFGADFLCMGDVIEPVQHGEDWGPGFWNDVPATDFCGYMQEFYEKIRDIFDGHL